MRESRVRRPACLSEGRSSSSCSRSAREIPWAMAPAWPATPPPRTLIVTSRRRSLSGTRSGCITSISSARRPRYWRGVLLLIMMRPSPGVSRTRAMAVWRRPTARFACCSDNLHVPLLVEGDVSGHLRPVLVVGTRVDTQPLQHLGAQGVVLQHSADGVLDGKRRVKLALLAKGAPPQPARGAGIPGVHLAVHLAPGDEDARGVDDDDVVARVQVGCVGRLVLALQDLRHVAGEPAQRDARGVDHVPVTLQVLVPGGPGLELRHA